MEEEDEFKPPDFIIEPPPKPPTLNEKKESKMEDETTSNVSTLQETDTISKETSEKTRTILDDISSIPEKMMESWASDSIKGIFITNSMFGLVFFVMGRFQMSFVLLIITVTAISYVAYNFVALRKRQLRQDQVSRLVFMTNHGLDNDILSMIVNELPSWVRFPEIESVRWINRSVTKLWKALRPCLDTYMCDMLNPTLAYYKPEALTLLEMRQFDLGSTPPQIQGIKCHDFTNDSVVIDLELRLVADSSSSIVAKVTAFGISLPVMLRHVNFIATLRIEMKSIRGALPCFDELHISFARKPKFEFDLAAGHKTLDLAHLPIVDRAIMDTVGMVLGWYVFPQTKKIPMRAAGDLLPAQKDDVVGVLFVTVLGARNVTDRKKSHHPSLYVETKFNGVTRKTRTTKQDEWYEDNVFKFVIKQEDVDMEKSLTMKLKQKRMIGGSFMIGATHIPISHIKIGEMLEEWVRLWSSKGHKESAELHVRVDLRITNRAADIHHFTDAEGLLSTHHQLLSSEEVQEEIKHNRTSKKSHASAFSEALRNAHKMVEDGIIDKEEFEHIKSVMRSEDKETTMEIEKSFHPSTTARRHSKFAAKIASRFGHANTEAPQHHHRHHSESFSHADTVPASSPRRWSHQDDPIIHQHSLVMNEKNRKRASSLSPVHHNRQPSLSHRFVRTDSESSERSVSASFSDPLRKTKSVCTESDDEVTLPTVPKKLLIETVSPEKAEDKKGTKMLSITIHKLSKVPVSPKKNNSKQSLKNASRQYFARVKYGKEKKLTSKCKCHGHEAPKWTKNEGTVSFVHGNEHIIRVEILRKRSILSNPVLGVSRLDLHTLFDDPKSSQKFVSVPVHVEGNASDSKLDLTISIIDS